MSVRETALQAHREAEAAAKREREERAARHLAEEAEKDATVLAWVHDPQDSHLARLFPATRWTLIDRKFPQETAVVCPDDDPTLLLIVSRSHLRASLAPDPVPVERPGRNRWIVGSRPFETVAELGQLLVTRDRERVEE